MTDIMLVTDISLLISNKDVCILEAIVKNYRFLKDCSNLVRRMNCMRGEYTDTT